MAAKMLEETASMLKNSPRNLIHSARLSTPEHAEITRTPDATLLTASEAIQQEFEAQQMTVPESSKHQMTGKRIYGSIWQRGSCTRVCGGTEGKAQGGCVVG